MVDIERYTINEVWLQNVYSPLPTTQLHF